MRLMISEFAILGAAVVSNLTISGNYWLAMAMLSKQPGQLPRSWQRSAGNLPKEATRAIMTSRS